MTGEEKKIKVKCTWCGKEIEKYISQLNKSGDNFCSRSHAAKFRMSNRNQYGKNNPAYKSSIKVKCNYCKKEIEKRPSELNKTKNYFCNMECLSLFAKFNNPNYNPLIKVKCTYCEKEIKRYESKTGIYFCNINHKAEWQSEGEGRLMIVEQNKKMHARPWHKENQAKKMKEIHRRLGYTENIVKKARMTRSMPENKLKNLLNFYERWVKDYFERNGRYRMCLLPEFCKSCEECGSSLFMEQERFCNRKCQNKFIGKKNARKSKKTRIYVSCSYCGSNEKKDGQLLWKSPSALRKFPHTYCSSECQNNAHSLKQRLLWKDPMEKSRMLFLRGRGGDNGNELINEQSIKEIGILTINQTL